MSLCCMPRAIPEGPSLQAAMQQQQHNTQAAKPVRTGLASANTRKVGVPTTFAAAASSYNREQNVLRCLPFTSWKSQQHA